MWGLLRLTTITTNTGCYDDQLVSICNMIANSNTCGQLQLLIVMIINSNVLGRTGTFCVIFTVLERFKVEQVIDVLQTVKLLRTKRPGIVEDLVSSLSCNCSYADTYTYVLL